MRDALRLFEGYEAVRQERLAGQLLELLRSVASQPHSTAGSQYGADDGRGRRAVHNGESLVKGQFSSPSRLKFMLGCRSLPSALASIWRTRSLVTPR